MLNEYDYKHKLNLIEKFAENTSKYVKPLSLAVLYDINGIYRSDFIAELFLELSKTRCKCIEFTPTLFKLVGIKSNYTFWYV